MAFCLGHAKLLAIGYAPPKPPIAPFPSLITKCRQDFAALIAADKA